MSPSSAAPGKPATEKPFVVDAHVHLYACFDRPRFLASAHANLGAAALKRGWRHGDYEAVLLFTEAAGDAAFESIVSRREVDGWEVAAGDERESVRLEHPDGRRLTLVCGYQVATREDLEVLAIGTCRRPPDGKDFEDSVAAAREAGAAVIIPWGFGKWSFARGKRVAALIERSQPGELAFGDNGGRVEGIGEPKLLRQARRAGFAVWRGTDPLPFPEQAGRVGRFGGVLERMPADDRPAAAIRARLGATYAGPVPYGRATRALDFAVAQFRMQVRKRLS